MVEIKDVDDDVIKKHKKSLFLLVVIKKNLTLTFLGCN